VFFGFSFLETPTKTRGLNIEALREAERSLRAVQNRDSDKNVLLRAFRDLDPRNPLLARIKEAISGGQGEKALHEETQTHARELIYRFSTLSRYWAQVSSTLPLLGMTGTIAGLLFMFNSGGGISDEKSTQLAGLGVALLTTLYASLATVLVCKQLAKANADKVADISYLAAQIEGCATKLGALISSYEIVEFERLQGMGETHATS
jgi:biopolymer transport protein ExbB/TolQ